MYNLGDKQSMVQMIQASELFEREACRRSFEYFAKYYWDTICHEKMHWNWHMSILCKELEETAWRVICNLPKKHDLIINISPGSSKSSLCTQMFPAWCWITRPTMEYLATVREEGFKLDYDKLLSKTGGYLRFICGSYSGDLSMEHADYTRDIIWSNKWKDMFGDEIKLRKDREKKTNFKTNMGGQRRCTSVGGTITGMHAHIIVIDDPINPEEAHSDKDRITANRWLSQTLSTRKVSKALTPTILIMQRLHTNDPTGYMMKEAQNGKKVKLMCIPGCRVSPRGEKFKVIPPELEKYYSDGTDKDCPKGNLMDPVRLPWSVLKEMSATLGAYGFAGQVGQKPILTEGGMFKKDDFMLVEHYFPDSQIIRSVRSWDKAGTEGGGKRTAGVLMHKLKNGGIFISDCKAGQWSTGKREEIIKATAIADGVETHIVFEQEPASAGKESAESTIKNLKGFIVKAIKPTGDKATRAEPFASQVEAHTVFVLKRQDWILDFLDEFEAFGPTCDFSDRVDATTQAFNYLFSQKKRVGLWGSQGE
jgi:predicted phage terminase large subunit-like protein